MKSAFWTVIFLCLCYLGYSELKSKEKIVFQDPAKPNYTLISYKNNSSCGKSIIQGFNQYVTARHCIDPNAPTKPSRYNDSPVLINSGKPIVLATPKVGLAKTIGFHFGQKVEIDLIVEDLDSCQAIFSVANGQNDINSYIQSGDSGSPVVQFRNGKPIVVGTLTGGLPEYRLEPIEGTRKRFTVGIFNYKDCQSSKYTVIK